MTARNGSSPDLYQLRHFKCYNWHNLTTQDGAIRGNIFNLGDVGTGKTTWMEGVQAALVLGEPRMRWNSAASQGVTIAEQEEGRDLLTIVLRYQQLTKKYRRANGVSYFAIELADEAGGHPLTIGIGASAASPQSRVNKWGFIIHKGLNEVAFVDDRGKILDHAGFENRNGRGNVYGVGEYILQLGNLLYGSQENFENVMRLWNLSKSYNELARQSKDFTDLFRRILEAPNENDYQQAIQHLNSIRKLTQEIREREATRDHFVEIQKHVNIVRREQGTLVRYDYFERLDDHRQAKSKRIQLQAAITGNKTKLTTAAAQAQTTNNQLAEWQSRLRDLEATGADALMGRRQALEEQRDQQSQRHDDQQKVVDARRKLHSQADQAAITAWGRFDIARQETIRSLEQVASRHPLPERAQEALRSIRESLKEVGPDHSSLPSSVTHARDEFEASISDQALKLERAALHAEAQVETLDEQLNKLKEEANLLKQNAELQPIPRLSEITAAIRGDVHYVYRAIQPLDGQLAEVALLESFLPPEILGALVPRQPGNTQLIRDYITRRTPAPEVRVVDAETLVKTKPSTLPGNSILNCLDGNASHPIAYAFLAAEYGNVILLDEGADRGSHSRVVWRNGDVYDGHAYRIELLKPTPQFLGAESRRKAVEKRLAEIAKEVAALDSRREAQSNSAAAARKTMAAALQAKRETADTLQASDLAANLSKAAVAKGDAFSRGTEYQNANEMRSREAELLTTLKERLEKLDARIRSSGADRSFAELLAARDRVTALDKASRDAEVEAGVLTREIARDETQLGVFQELENQAEVRERELVPKLRQLASEETPPIANVDDYLRNKGFNELRRDRIERNRADANSTINRAKSDIGTLIDRIRPEVPFEYRDDLNQVLELATGKPITDHIATYNGRLNEEYKRKAELYTAYNTRIIVDNMARQLRRDQSIVRQRIDELNRVLAETPIGRRSYRIHVAPDNDHPDIAQMRKYVEESREEAKMDALAAFIKSHLEKSDPTATKVPAIFDYRYWYKFTPQARAISGGPDVELQRGMGSGGEQAIPNYLICFALFHILYERIHAKFRLVILDEAFDKISAKEINQMLQAADRLRLTVIATSNKLEPVPVEQGWFTTQVFRVNDQDDSIIERFGREKELAP